MRYCKANAVCKYCESKLIVYCDGIMTMGGSPYLYKCSKCGERNIFTGDLNMGIDVTGGVICNTVPNEAIKLDKR
ncbi:hypothetical protein ACU5EH_25525 [Aliivibrio salmonicida]|uniref:hypothetical protein n=1 Tax=Aliivibrio salmonicida TaxID=40269 RepID=UPI00406C903F